MRLSSLGNTEVLVDNHFCVLLHMFSSCFLISCYSCRQLSERLDIAINMPHSLLHPRPHRLHKRTAILLHHCPQLHVAAADPAHPLIQLFALLTKREPFLIDLIIHLQVSHPDAQYTHAGYENTRSVPSHESDIFCRTGAGSDVSGAAPI